MPRKALAWCALWFVLWAAVCGCHTVPRHTTLKVRVFVTPVSTEVVVDATLTAADG